jgi:foldase protein PrsA
MEPQAQNPAAEPAPNTRPTNPGQNRRRWLIAGGGTALLLLTAAALMQVWRSEEGVAAETGRETAGKASVGDAPATRVKNLARVGDAVITYDQVSDEAMTRYGAEVLDQLINRTVIELACRKQGVVVTEVEVEQEITKTAQEFGLDRATWMQMLQAERNITPLQYKRDVIWPMLALKKLAGTNVRITEADIKQAFERDYGPRVKARMIMNDNQRRMQEVWQKAQDAVAAANAESAKTGLTGADAVAKAANEFGRVAREHSIEPQSKSLDGAVPPIRRHTGPENANVENAAFNLKPGEVSGIIQLPTPGAPRYVVLFCEGRTEPVVTPDKMSLVRDEIVAQLEKEKVQQSVAEVFKKIKDETPVHNFLTNTSTGGTSIQPAGATASAPGIGAPGIARPRAAASDATPIRR